MNACQLLRLATLIVAVMARNGWSDELTSGHANEVMSTHTASVRKCYMKHAFKQKQASGQVMLGMRVTKGGRVSSVNVAAAGVRGKRFKRCIGRAATAWRFPSSNTASEVQYLYTNSPARAKPARKRAIDRPSRTSRARRGSRSKPNS